MNSEFCNITDSFKGNDIFLVHTEIPELIDVLQPFDEHYWLTALPNSEEHVVQHSNIPVKDKFPVSKFHFPSTNNDPCFDHPSTNSEKCRYTMDCLDYCFVDWFNERSRQRLPGISADEFEWTMMKLEDFFIAKLYNEYGLSYTMNSIIKCDICRGERVNCIDDMLVCDGCDVAVHKFCYNIKHIDDKKAWLCLSCSENSRPGCIFCPSRKGAFKPAKRPNTKSWVHESCAYFISPKKILRPLAMLDNVDAITELQTSENMKCTVCFSKYGIVVKCMHSECNRYFHVTCALDTGLYIRRVFSNTQNLKAAYCMIHMLTLKAKLDECPYLADSTELPSYSSLIKQNKTSILRKLDIAEVMKSSQIRNDLNDVVIYWKEKKLAHTCDFLPGYVSNLPRPKKNEINKQAAISNSIMQFIILRQSLESVRHLCYMLIKREKLKQSLITWENTRLGLRLKQHASLISSARRSLTSSNSSVSNPKQLNDNELCTLKKSSSNKHPSDSSNISCVTEDKDATQVDIKRKNDNSFDTKISDDFNNCKRIHTSDSQPSLPKLLYFENGSF